MTPERKTQLQADIRDKQVELSVIKECIFLLEEKKARAFNVLDTWKEELASELQAELPLEGE
jgi:hypothetical protein